MADLPIRAFIALPLSPKLRDRISMLQRRLAPLVPPRSVRWIPPSNIHVTLFFIGDIVPHALPEVRAALANVASTTPSFEFQVQGLGAFPNLKRPQIVWVGIKQSWPLTLLHKAINEAMSQVGFKPETRPFSPHLTIARVGRRVNAETAHALGTVIGQPKHDPGILGTSPAHEIVLYSSTLKASGAAYEVIDKFTFSE